MTVQSTPFALQNAAHSAAVFRQAVSAPWMNGGYIGPNELLVSAQSTPNMSVILGAGRAKVPGSNVGSPILGNGVAPPFTTQAMYDVLNDAPITLTIAAADPTNPRIDTLWIGIQDSYYSGSNNQAIAGIVTGLPGPTPNVPSPPQNAISIAAIAVAANATSITSGNISFNASQATLQQSLDTALMSWYQTGGGNYTQVIGYPPQFRMGEQNGTTSSGGTLSSNFSFPFPNGVSAVILMPTNNSNFSSPPVVIENTVTRSGFETFWAGKGSTGVSCPYVAIGY